MEAIEQLRAAVYLAFDEGGTVEAESKMPEDLLEAFHDGAKILAKHGQPDEMMRMDYQHITGKDSEL